MRHIPSIDHLSAETLYIFLPGYSAPGEDEAFRDSSVLLNAVANGLAYIRARSVRDHVRVHRDYYANPRSPAYMIEAAGTLVARSTIHRIVAVVGSNIALTHSDIPWTDELKSVSSPLTEVTWAQIGVVPGPDDVALLLHSDALGLGLTAFETTLLSAGFRQVGILNGRRRCYRLTPRLRRTLGRHRFHSEVRIVEASIAVLAQLAGRWISFRDWFSREEPR